MNKAIPILVIALIAVAAILLVFIMPMLMGTKPSNLPQGQNDISGASSPSISGLSYSITPPSGFGPPADLKVLGKNGLDIADVYSASGQRQLVITNFAFDRPMVGTINYTQTFKLAIDKCKYSFQSDNRQEFLDCVSGELAAIKAGEHNDLGLTYVGEGTSVNGCSEFKAALRSNGAAQNIRVLRGCCGSDLMLMLFCQAPDESGLTGCEASLDSFSFTCP